MTMLYLAARTLVTVLQALPLTVVARMGRTGGALAWHLDARHRKVALENLRLAFPEKTRSEIRALALENFRRIGESYASAVKTASLSLKEVMSFCEVHGLGLLARPKEHPEPRNYVFAIGHFGNFELNATMGKNIPGFQPATTYRSVRPESVDRLLRRLREQSGCLYFERRHGTGQLRQALGKGRIALGLLCDQHAGRGGVLVDFFGRPCFATAAPAVLALRYQAPLFVGICYRTGLARWRYEIGPEIPLRISGKPRPIKDIVQDIAHALEAAIRRDPANWFWVHNRWKTRTPRPVSIAPAANATLEQK